MLAWIVVAITLFYLFWPIRYAGKVKLINADKQIKEPSTYMTGYGPQISGLMIKIYCYVTNTIFGKILIDRSAHKDDLLGKTVIYKATSRNV